MARHNRYSVRGLYQLTDELGRARWAIDLRWTDRKSGRRERYRRLLPAGTKPLIARNEAVDALNRMIAGTLGSRTEETKRLHGALDAYADAMATERPRTARSRRSLVKVAKRFLRNMDIRELAALDLERLKRDRLESPLASKANAPVGSRPEAPRRAAGPARSAANKSPKALAPPSPSTINRLLAMLVHFAAWAARQGWYDEADVTRLRRVPKLREPPGRVRELAPAEEDELFDAIADSQIRRPVALAMLTGLRRADVVHLRRSQVDLALKRLVIERTKSNKPLVVPLNADAVRVVREALSDAGETSDYVFLSTREVPRIAPDGETTYERVPYTLDGFSTMWQRARRAAGVKNFRFHDLRHTFASRVRRGGAGLDVIARLLGHATIAMSARYTHLDDAALADAVNVVKLSKAAK